MPEPTELETLRANKDVLRQEHGEADYQWFKAKALAEYARYESELAVIRAQLRTAEEAREMAETASWCSEKDLSRVIRERDEARTELAKEKQHHEKSLAHLGRANGMMRALSADLAAISALFPDNAPHKSHEAGVSLLDDVRDALVKIDRLKGETK